MLRDMATTEFRHETIQTPATDGSVERPFGISDEELHALPHDAQVALFIKHHMEAGTVFSGAQEYMAKVTEATHLERQQVVDANKSLMVMRSRDADRKAYTKNVEGGIVTELTRTGEQYLEKSVEKLRGTGPETARRLGSTAINEA